MGAAQTGCCSNRPGKENAYEDTDAPVRKQREPTEEGDPGAEHENEGSEDGQEETEGQATKTDGDTNKEGEGDEENLPVEQLLAESQKEVAQAEKALESQKTADGPKKEGEEGGAKFESTEGLPTKEKDDELSSPPTTPKKIDKLQVFTQVSPYQKDHVWYPIGSDGTTRLGVIRLCMFFDPTKEIMYVDVLNCENLVSPDKSGSADPYVKMRLRPGDTHKQKTTVVKKSLNPKFGQAFEFRVTRDQFDKESTAIEVGVWSSFSLKHNRLLGWILVDVNRLPQYNYDSLGKQRPASTLFTYALQPEHVYTLGACSLRKGDTIRYPDGSMRLPDGSFLDEGKATSKTLHSPHPGATLLHDGTIRQYDGSVILPSGAVLRPDGLLRLPSGLLRKPEWACHKVPLPRDVEQREDFKFYIEKQKVVEPERSNAALSVGVLRVSLKATKSSKKLHVFVAEARGLPIPKKSKMQTIIKVLLTPLPKRAPQEYEMVYTKPRPPTTPHLSSNTTPPPQLSPRGTLSTTTAAASPAEQTPRRRHSNAPSPPGSRDNSVLDSPTSVFAFPDKKRRNSAPLSVMEDAKGEAKKTKAPSKKHEGEPVWNEHFKFKLAELKEFKDKELDHYYLRLLIVRGTADKQGEALGYIEIDLPKDNNEIAAWYAIQPPYPASGKPETELSGSNLLGRRASRSPSPTPPHTPRREDGEAPPSPTSPGTLPLTLPAHATAAAATPSPAAAPAASDPHHQDSAAAASAATTSGTTTTTTSAELTSTSSSSTLSPGAASP